MSKNLTAEDFDLIFAGESIELGKSVFIAKPFTLDEFGELKIRLKSILKKADITLENLSKNVLKLAELILKENPEIISDAIDLDVNDFKRLPAAKRVSIATTVVAVNVKSFEGLEKNLAALVQAVPQIMQGVSLILSSNSNEMGQAKAK